MASQSETDFIMSSGTWNVANHPYGCKYIGCKWGFKNKLRPNGTIESTRRDLCEGLYPE